MFDVSCPLPSDSSCPESEGGMRRLAIKATKVQTQTITVVAEVIPGPAPELPKDDASAESEYDESHPVGDLSFSHGSK